MKLPKKGPSLTVRIREILDKHGCPEETLQACTVDLREMACKWRDERGSNGRRQGFHD